MNGSASEAPHRKHRPEQVDGIEGTTVDLRLGAVSGVWPRQAHADVRMTPEITRLMDIEEDPTGVLR